MMTPEQRYLLDATGYLHIKNPLSDEELNRAQEAADRYINTPNLPPRELEPTVHHDRYSRGFAYDKALEHLTMHPSVWPIIKELSGNKPALARGTLIVDTHEHNPHALHAGPGQFGKAVKETGEPGTLFCEYFDVFWYLTDVHPGDGGLLLGPGSHDSGFECPYAGNVYNSADDLPRGVINIAPSAGDAIVLPERLLHGALKWKPKDRDRRALLYRYAPQYLLMQSATTNDFDIRTSLEDRFKARLAPETQELVKMAFREHVKEIATRDEIRLI